MVSWQGSPDETRRLMKPRLPSHKEISKVKIRGQYSGADPGFFLGGGALVSCSTSTPINHIFFLAEYQLY